MGDSAGEFYDFEAALDVAAGVGNGFAVFAGEQAGEFFHVLVDEVYVAHHYAGAALGVLGGPGGLCGGGVFYGGVYFFEGG